MTQGSCAPRCAPIRKNMKINPFTAPLPPITTMAFVGNRLDRADHIRTNAVALAAACQHPGARVLAFAEENLSLSADGLIWQPINDMPADSALIFLGLEGDAPRFATALPKGSALPGKPAHIHMAGTKLPPDQSAIVAQSRSLLLWHDRHRHCAVCGAATMMSKGGYVRHCTDDACKAEHFPRTDPVTIMLVIDGEHCLLGRQPKFPAGFYSALAGFLEPGETIEEAVRREVKEEAGINVGQVRYVASQPWPFPSTLMIGCFAEALGTDIIIDKTELDDARWFSRAECAAVFAGAGPFAPPPQMAIAHHLLKSWLALA
jgi:NAD+ diphosphatase